MTRKRALQKIGAINKFLTRIYGELKAKEIDPHKAIAIASEAEKEAKKIWRDHLSAKRKAAKKKKPRKPAPL